MQDLSDHLIQLISKQLMTTMGCLVDHIHLDNNTFNILFLIKEQYVLLYYLDFLIVIVYIYIYINNLI
jgi:hypothetical protein